MGEGFFLGISPVFDMNQIYDTLNSTQREAVFHTEGPLLILAGAGSGKTRVLTHRICYLIEERGVDPYHILAITFTNKAAEEMKNRVENLVGEEGGWVWVATFHSTCVRILRRYIDRLGYDNRFTIYDTDDQKAVVNQVLKKLSLDVKQFSPRMVLGVISKCKETGMSPQEYREGAYDYRERKLAEIYFEYEATLKKNNALDFDDLLLKTVELFRSCPDVLEYYQDRFRYIHVDEYQDTNGIQFQFISLLARSHQNLCVVGDDDQSIYSFRGADIRNILDFEEVFPNAKVIKLEQNYRSTPNILDVANDIIRNNTSRKSKRLWTQNASKEVVRFQQFDNAFDEAATVASEIRQKVLSGASYSDCAILYRTNAQSRSFEEVCVKQNIPYRIVGGINFYQRAEIKDVLAYLKTIANGKDDLATRRIINVPKRGIGQTSIDRVQSFADEQGISFFRALQRAREIPGLGRGAEKIHGFVSEILVFRVLANEMPLGEFVERVVEDIHYENELEKLDEEQAIAKEENINELIGKAASFELDEVEYYGMDTDWEGEEPEEMDSLSVLAAFLEQVALVADVDSVDAKEDRVLLMTLHGAKGLEFDHVFLTGMEEGLFPSSMAIYDGGDKAIEEERRLCYVGVTRAKKTLLMTGSKVRMTRGEVQYNPVSRFVKEIADHLLEKKGTSRFQPKQYRFDEEEKPTTRVPGGLGSLGYGVGVGFGKPVPATPSKNPGFGKVVPMGKPDHLPYQEGDTVMHQRFGKGYVRSIEDKGKDYAVTVEFEGSVGTKKMMSQFAQLTPLKL